MKKGIILLLVLVMIIILASLFVIYCNPLSKYIETSKENADNPNLPNVDNENSNPDSNSENTNLQDTESENTEPATAGSSTNTNTDNKTNLPSDLYTASCGFYYESYGVCAGTCPEGVCSSEGRSCYCKKN
jgi:cytoskeletal protein RodZ